MLAAGGRVSAALDLVAGMRSDLLNRVRWANLARAAAVLVIVAAVVLWPRLGPPEPALPADAPEPVASVPEPGPEPIEEFGFEPEPERTPRPRRSGPKPRRAVPQRSAPPRAAEPPATPVRRWYPPVAPAPVTEFGPE